MFHGNRFIIKAPEGPPRKDKRLGNVIISEKKDKAISKHQVSLYRKASGLLNTFMFYPFNFWRQNWAQTLGSL